MVWYQHLSKWASPKVKAISLFTSVGSDGQSLETIAQRFELSRSKAAAMLSFLIGAGLCREEKGNYFIGTQRTHIEEDSPYLPRHDSNWRLRAIQRSEALEPTELMYTSAVSLSRSDFEILREEMVVFIRNFLDKVKASPAEEIACFNLDFFWIKKWSASAFCRADFSLGYRCCRLVFNVCSDRPKYLNSLIIVVFLNIQDC